MSQRRLASDRLIAHPRPFMNEDACTANASPPPAGHRVHREPLWRPVKQFTTGELAPAVRRWLLDDGSLTGRLIDQCRGPFSVQRLYQGWDVPLPSERRLLRLPQRQLSIVREVVLRQGDDSVVFARSVLPLTSLTGKLAHLRRLQNRPLGAILFNHAGMRRSPFEVARLDGASDYIPAFLRQQEPAWARRSRFTIDGRSLMVSEVFLHAFQPWPAVLPVHRTQRGKVSAAILSPKQ
ncbi:chorismate lyase [Seongchinamella unica]|uniref:Probable chorismate pyruvate-lyase n=1 Tax=Seongchinamella unica TaxID=2547392 RepID=A0A4V2ZXN7_9GAMM|nr:chorismate lyase [Seongchinamella unica]TDG15715.1 chorismate lyase [Seongchinamella unica]